MTPALLREWIVAAMRELTRARDELTSLDSASGDGDLGFTVAAGTAAIVDALTVGDEMASVAEVLRTAGAAFARGNPSSFAALMAAGVLAAARELDGVSSPGVDDVITALDAAAAMIAQRGRSQLGDRTVLDALLPSLVALRSCRTVGASEQFEAMVLAAREGARRTEDMVPRRGRAVWVGGGTDAFGVQDGGAVAYTRLLEALQSTMVPRLGVEARME